MNFERVRKMTGGILLVSLMLLGVYQPFQEYLQIPERITIFEGQEYRFSKSATVTVASVYDDQSNIEMADQKSAVSIAGKKPGEEKLILELAGFPVKNVNVDVLKDFKVFPGGQSIGVKLNTLGVLVVGHHLVDGDNEKLSPGEQAGIQVGDIITKIEGNTVGSMTDVAPYVDEAGEKGKPLQLLIQRGQEKLDATLHPALDKADQKYKMGLYIRDSAAGIGTMTFYDAHSKKYGALGHVISDMDTKKPIVVDDGQIVKSTVTSIEKGKNGLPGEKLARFSSNREVIGNITTNSPFGIFGKLNQSITNGILDRPMPIALSHQVNEGPAKILTVVDGNEVEEFDIEIISTIPQKFPATKGMVIKVTDPKLLSKTGGIVQGMSGSPIIQDEKIVGAVTHVFVNDPTSGYGVHIEWMLHEAGIDIYQQGQKTGKAS